MPKFDCKDLGMNCSWSTEAENLDQLFDEIKRHAAEAHGITEFSPELVEKVKSLIRE